MSRDRASTLIPCVAQRDADIAPIRRSPACCAGIAMLASAGIAVPAAASPSDTTTWDCALAGLSTHTTAVDLSSRYPMLVESCSVAPYRAASVQVFVVVPPESKGSVAPPAEARREVSPPVRLIQREANPPASAAPWPAPRRAALPGGPFGHLVADAAARHGVDPALIDAVIRVESGHDPRARSHKGARGLMQLMPDTARRFGVDDPAKLDEPAVNIDAGTRYLATLLRMFDERLDLALAAYNAGEGAVLRNGWRIPPYSETRQYVASVLAHWERSRNAGINRN